MSRVVTATRHTLPYDGWYNVYAYSGTNLARPIRCRRQPPDAVDIVITTRVWERLPGLYVTPTFGLPMHDVATLYQEDWEED